MKRRVASNSGTTLIEVILALVFLIIIVVGFSALYNFAGTTVNYAGQDSSTNAGARSEANKLLSEQVDPDTGKPTEIGIVWNGDDDDEQIIQVIRDSVGIPGRGGSDGEINIYRRPEQEEQEIEPPPESEIINYIHITVFITTDIILNIPLIPTEDGIPASAVLNHEVKQHFINEYGFFPQHWKALDPKDVVGVEVDTAVKNADFWNTINNLPPKPAEIYAVNADGSLLRRLAR